MTFRIANLPVVYGRVVRAFEVKPLIALPDKIKLREGLSLSQAASKLGISKSQLKDLGVSSLYGININKLKNSLEKRIPSGIRLREGEERSVANIMNAVVGRLGKEEIVLKPFEVEAVLDRKDIDPFESFALITSYIANSKESILVAVKLSENELKIGISKNSPRAGLAVEVDDDKIDLIGVFLGKFVLATVPDNRFKQANALKSFAKSLKDFSLSQKAAFVEGVSNGLNLTIEKQREFSPFLKALGYDSQNNARPAPANETELISTVINLKTSRERGKVLADFLRSSNDIRSHAACARRVFEALKWEGDVAIEIQLFNVLYGGDLKKGMEFMRHLLIPNTPKTIEELERITVMIYDSIANTVPQLNLDPVQILRSLSDILQMYFPDNFPIQGTLIGSLSTKFIPDKLEERAHFILQTIMLGDNWTEPENRALVLSEAVKAAHVPYPDIEALELISVSYYPDNPQERATFVATTLRLLEPTNALKE